MSSAAEAAAKWGKSLDVEEADPTPSGQCHKAGTSPCNSCSSDDLTLLLTPFPPFPPHTAFMGGVAGAVMGGMYGAGKVVPC